MSLRFFLTLVILCFFSFCHSSANELSDRDIASDILHKIETAATCTACQAILELLKGVAELGDTIFVDTLTEICKLSGIQDDDVCEGLIKLEGPIVASDLRGMSIESKTSVLFCTTFLGLCSYPAVTPYTIPFPKPKPSTGRPAPSGRDPIQIVQYSDIHVDHLYVTGSNTNCTKPICCRDYSSSDAPGNNDSPAGPNGHHECNAPVSLEESMYAAIRDIAPNAQFTIFTGDVVDQVVWNTTQAQNTFDINDAYSKMSSSFEVVYGVVGNHEMSPTNAIQTTAEGKNAQWLYDLLSSTWTKWIGASSAAEADKIGAYSVVHPWSKLRIISLNTNFYYVLNFYLFEKTMEKDPSSQFAWLVNELQSAEDAGERVYLIGHMPMGCSDAFHDGSNYFDQIVNRYSATIAAMFFGHTHYDEIEVSYSNYSAQTFANAVGSQYICPSMTPGSGNPAFRVYSVDPGTFAILDSTTYIAIMDDASFQTSPKWTKYYSAREAYGPIVNPPLAAGEELSPAFWHNVTEAFKNDDTAFNQYISRKSRGWNVQNCTGDCKTEEICQMRAGRSEDNCYVPTPGIHFSKRDVDEKVMSAHHDECGVSATRSALSALVHRKDLLEMVAGRAQRR